MNNFLLNTVIVPWDFSDMSKTALAAALEMVDSPEKIEVVQVTSYTALMEPGGLCCISKDAITENLKKSFRNFAKDAKLPDLKFTTVFGDPGSCIAEVASESDAGLIVISSHGRTGLDRILLGSVAERVVRLAHCPVLVLRGMKES